MVLSVWLGCVGLVGGYVFVLVLCCWMIRGGGMACLSWKFYGAWWVVVRGVLGWVLYLLVCRRRILRSG